MTAPDDPNSLALSRTLLAYDRTLMAWVRTAVSLIGFGFSVYKFFRFLSQDAIAATPHHQILGPRRFALLLIALGVGGLIAATVEYQLSRRDYVQKLAQPRFTLAAIFAIVTSVFGVFAFIATLLDG